MHATATAPLPRIAAVTPTEDTPMDTTSDEALIGRIAAGDKAAMQALFQRYQIKVYRFVLRLVRNEATAEDLISDVFLDRIVTAARDRVDVARWIHELAGAGSIVDRAPCGAAHGAISTCAPSGSA